MDGEGEPGDAADRGEQLAEGNGGHRPASLAGEGVGALGHLLALQLPERADLLAPEQVHAGAAVLAAGDVVAALREVEHVPAERADFARPEPVAVGEHDHGRVPAGVAGADALPRGGDQALGLFGGEVLAGSPLGIGQAARQDIPIYGGWPAAFLNPFVTLIAIWSRILGAK